MTDHDHDHDHDHQPSAVDPAIRTEALEQLLIERGLVTTNRIEDLIRHYEEEVGPMNGAKVVAAAWLDPEYKARLLEDGAAAIAELGFGGAQGERIVVVENTDDVHNVVVCTLCSCYPWPVLGLPPSWYKSPEYRARVAREPRAVLAEFGTDLPDETTIRVWDSSAEVRYFVLPQRPEGAAGDTVDDLAPLVTRDSMIGVRVVPSAAK
ncbi:MAG: nitrile hydratase subunit alpha [Actinomycetota bacterium]|nr:nitrile hydratase subunit alpha [Actinomycetota bacterium]